MKKKHDWNKVIELHAAGLSIPEITAELKMPRDTVRTILNRSGIKTGNKDSWYWTKEEEKVLIKYYSYGLAFVMDKLPNKTKWSIINKYRELSGLRSKK